VSALTGVITDPRSLKNKAYPRFKEPQKIIINTMMLVPPSKNPNEVKLTKGPNIQPLPILPPLADNIEGPVLIKVGDDISTDTILPAGAKVLPFRSNIPGISQFVFDQIDPSYPKRALEYQKTGSIIVGGENYGQGSSREHAAIAPRYLGVQAVLVKQFARIHRQNLVNFGILPLIFSNPVDYDTIDQGDVLLIKDIRETIQKSEKLIVHNKTKNKNYTVTHPLTSRELKVLLAGGLINWIKQ
jgi:aconitate hydratase